MASSGSNYNYGDWIFYLQMVFEEKAISIVTIIKVKDVPVEEWTLIRSVFTFQY